MIYFFTLFERTDEKETLKSQEKSLETIEFTKEALIQVVSLLKDLIKGFKESNPRLFPLSDQEILFIYTSEPNKGLYKLIQLFPGIKEPILNENMIIGLLKKF